MSLDENVPENLLRKLQVSTGLSQPGEKEGQSGPGRGQGIGSEAYGAHVGHTAEETLGAVRHGLILHSKKKIVSVSRCTT